MTSQQKRERLTLVKVGGKVLETPATLERFLNDFTAISGPKLLVHGGGRTATDVAARLGVETVMVGGRRVTDEAMLRVVTMVYGGLVNKQVVAALQQRGVNALGLTGADLNLICSHRRPAGEVDYGFVGDVDRVDGLRLRELLLSGVTPVMAPLTHDGQGTLLNTNADTIASETAKALAPCFDVTLVYCFEHAGVLQDPEREDSVISCLDRATFDRLKAAGIVAGGMIPKLENCLAAVDAGVSRVVITKADAIDGTSGTTIVA